MCLGVGQNVLLLITVSGGEPGYMQETIWIQVDKLIVNLVHDSFHYPNFQGPIGALIPVGEGK